eukprot:CAMPEP_0196579262 /NCGR_PEP_ID=MMETSP1081-20130531/19817_1 /TAXON_ID=36882 /ORGANISM="Pyramimonas amylifera, Strain CCMP720" /LENGTH=153 /DNA_ID=CAMNT_0041898779 /DNA_START=27 /DNA_END=488 /DNA_ORIENTATION=-
MRAALNEVNSSRRCWDILLVSLLFSAIIGGVVFYARTNALKARQADVLASASTVAASYNREKEDALRIVRERDGELKALKEALTEAKQEVENLAKSLRTATAEHGKTSKALGQAQLERERCCAGRDILEKFCKEYLDAEVLSKDDKKTKALLL